MGSFTWKHRRPNKGFWCVCALQLLCVLGHTITRPGCRQLSVVMVFRGVNPAAAVLMMYCILCTMLSYFQITYTVDYKSYYCSLIVPWFCPPLFLRTARNGPLAGRRDGFFLGGGREHDLERLNCRVHCGGGGGSISRRVTALIP